MSAVALTLIAEFAGSKLSDHFGDFVKEHQINRRNMQTIPLPEPQTPAPITYDPDYFESHFTHHTPIVIDNGSTYFRYGWATSTIPYVSQNLYAKYREKRTNKPVFLFGDAVDADTQARNVAKSPWEGDHLNNHEALEAAMDFAFIRLGIEAETITHPVIMTERLCSLASSRSLASEMMFELYSIPTVTYAVDALMSFAHNNLNTPLDKRDGLVLSFNTASTSVIPILDGKGILAKTKRLPWGGQQAADYLLKLIQLKYPYFPTRVTQPHSNWMYQTFSEFSENYTETLRNLDNPEELSRADRVVQYPYSVSPEKVKTEEELAAIAERRRESGRRLQEQAAKKRLERLIEKEKALEHDLNVKGWKGKESEASFITRLNANGYDSEKALDESIKKLEADLKRARKKDLQEDEIMEEPTFTLLETPDTELDDEGVKEKRRQKLLKGLHEARIRARLEKEKEKAAAIEEARLEEEERTKNLTGWAGRLKQEHEATMLRMKGRERRKADLQDRKSAASQNRMKSITNLTTDSNAISKKKRKKGADDDNFGANDEDWLVYHQINNTGNGSSEEEDLAALGFIESRLLAHDPSFSASQTYASIVTKKSALIRAFCPPYDSDSGGESSYRIHLNVERWKVPEAWFIPGMAGVDYAGLGEVITNVLNSFPFAERTRLAGNILLTGGPARIPNIQPRVYSTVRPLMDPGIPISVSLASDPSLDAWHGMSAFARSPEFGKPEFGAISKADYDEHGSDRIRKWWGGNSNYAI